jgi:glycine/D-amino acid oxidase-like deaminating enzyme
VTAPAARLAPTYEERVLWQEQADPPALEPHALPTEADTVVIGAGYCGLSAGRTLAERGRAVVVLDRDPLGTGASTRNGGMVIPELKAGPAALSARYGPLGARLHAEVDEAFDHVEALVADEAIDCDYERTGQLYLAHNRAHAPVLAEMAEELGGDRGEPVHYVRRDALDDEIGSTAFYAGLVLERTGAIHPARFHAGLARLALNAGADLHDRTTAVAVRRRDRAEGFDVLTDRGTVRARAVLLATNAYADGLVPWLQRRVVPIGSFIIATEVLDPELARSVSPRRRMMVDTKNLLFYWRLSPDGRVLFGGRRSLSPTRLADARDFLYESMVRLHPQLASTAVERAWGGHVAMTLDRLPHFGRVPTGEARDAVFATGCNGSGVALNTWLGRRAADVLTGGPPPSFAELRFPAVPLHRARRAYLPLVGQWFTWQDRKN